MTSFWRSIAYRSDCYGVEQAVYHNLLRILAERIAGALGTLPVTAQGQRWRRISSLPNTVEDIPCIWLLVFCLPAPLSPPPFLS